MRVRRSEESQMTYGFLARMSGSLVGIPAEIENTKE